MASSPESNIKPSERLTDKAILEPSNKIPMLYLNNFIYRMMMIGLTKVDSFKKNRSEAPAERVYFNPHGDSFNQRVSSTAGSGLLM